MILNKSYITLNQFGLSWQLLRETPWDCGKFPWLANGANGLPLKQPVACKWMYRSFRSFAPSMNDLNNSTAPKLMIIYIVPYW